MSLLPTARFFNSSRISAGKIRERFCKEVGSSLTQKQGKTTFMVGIKKLMQRNGQRAYQTVNRLLDAHPGQPQALAHHRDAGKGHGQSGQDRVQLAHKERKDRKGVKDVDEKKINDDDRGHENRHPVGDGL